MPRNHKETHVPGETAEGKPVAPSHAGLSDGGIQAVQGPPELDSADVDLLAEMDAMRQQREAEAAADAVTLDTKSDPKRYTLTDTGESDWVDRGIQDVPVVDLPWPEGINGTEDFNHHIAYDDAIRAAQQLEEMKPLIARGFTSEGFANRDAAAGLDYEHGQQRIYDLYYGNNAIRLNRDGDSYDIISGRHRIYVAKELGIDSVPARVKERTMR
jgi:hypothetical protein